MSKTKKSNKTIKDPFAKREAGKYDNPIVSREAILAHLEKSKTPQTHWQMVEAFHLQDDEQIEALRRRLIAMCRDGQLFENRRRQFMPISAAELIQGRIQGHKDGYGFVIPDDGSNDLHLSQKQMRKVFDGDKVNVREVSDNRGKREAIIVEIMQRNTHQVVGRFYMQGDAGYVVPDNRRITQEILVNPQDMKDALHGQFVVAEILVQPDNRQIPIGRITEVLGDHLAPGMEIDVALRSHEIPHEFNQTVLDQVKAIPDEVEEKDKAQRIDLRDLPLVTIDGEDAKDFDDAVYAKYNPKTKGYTLYVAIADVSHYVGVNTPLDVEAQNRGNSVYFPEFVVPMLPEKLSNGLCSLKPKVDRLCMVCEMTISKTGRLSGYKFYEGILHSHARLTYNLVGKILSEDSENEAAMEEREQLREQYDYIVPQLEDLHGLYKVLRKSRTERGAIDFETTETRIIFNSERKIEDIVPVVRNDAHKLIEECMLIANVATARFLEKQGMPSLYRVHQGPTEQKLANVKQYLNELGIILSGGEKPTPKDYAEVLQQVQDRPDAHLIQTMLLRSMSQAVYQPDNEGHFGLAFPAYTHFTSPIRRYPDLLVHRAIRCLIRSKKDDEALLKHIRRVDGAKAIPQKHIYPYDTTVLLQLGEQCSMTERRADDATRDVADFLKCEYMRSHIGDQFTGVVSSVTNFGLFVELNDLFIEGLVHVSNLDSDFYNFDPVRMVLKGERTGKRFHMGDTVEVIVSRVDLDDRKIDFQLVDGSSVKRFKPKKKSSSKSAKGVRKRAVSDSDKNEVIEHSRNKKKALMEEAKQANKKKKPSKRQKLNKKKSAAKKSKKSKKK